MKWKDAPWKKNYDKPRQCIKKQRHYLAYKGSYSQSYGFSSSHVCMWELDHNESWALKNWCFWTVVLEKTLESPLDCKESSKPVNPKGNQLAWRIPGMGEPGGLPSMRSHRVGHDWSDLAAAAAFIGRTDAKLWFPYFSHLMQRTESFEKTLMLGMIESERWRGQQRMRWLDGIITDLMDMSLSKLQELVMPSNHLVLCRPLLLLSSIFPSIRVFSNE